MGKQSMNAQEKIKEMIRMQMALDSAVTEVKGIDPTKEQRHMALMDEVGELMHELKPQWCWWKIHVGEVDRAKVLEELVDVWHLGMSLFYTGTYYLIGGKEWDFNMSMVEYFESKELNIIISNYMKHGFDDGDFSIEYLWALTRKLGFTIDDVYHEYKRKNKVNYERLENGY